MPIYFLDILKQPMRLRGSPTPKSVTSPKTVGLATVTETLRGNVAGGML